MKNSLFLTLALGFSLILPIQSQAREDDPPPAPTVSPTASVDYDATSDYLHPDTGTVGEPTPTPGSCELGTETIDGVQFYAENCLNREFDESLAGSDLQLRCMSDQTVYVSLCSGDLGVSSGASPEEVDTTPVGTTPEPESEGTRLAKACLRTYHCSLPSASVTPPGTTPPGETPPGTTTATLTGISPNTAQEGGSGVALVVRGTNFSSSSIVLWNGRHKTTSFVSATELHAQIDAADIAHAGIIPVTVLTGAVVTGPAQNFTITAITVTTGTSTHNDGSAETTIGLPGSGGSGNPADPSSGGGCSLGLGSQSAMTFSVVMMSFLSGAFLMLRRQKNQH